MHWKVVGTVKVASYRDWEIFRSLFYIATILHHHNITQVRQRYYLPLKKSLIYFQQSNTVYFLSRIWNLDIYPNKYLLSDVEIVVNLCRQCSLFEPFYANHKFHSNWVYSVLLLEYTMLILPQHKVYTGTTEWILHDDKSNLNYKCLVHRENLDNE